MIEKRSQILIRRHSTCSEFTFLIVSKALRTFLLSYQNHNQIAMKLL